jgi:hypothetical protein
MKSPLTLCDTSDARSLTSVVAGSPQQANLLLAFKSLLEDMVPAAVRHEVDNAAAVQ